MHRHPVVCRAAATPTFAAERRPAKDMSEIDRGSVLGKRRFLLVVSFVLAVFHYYGASLSEQIKTPIIELNYTPPRFDIGVVLWLSWGWGLLRYYQYETTFK